MCSPSPVMMTSPSDCKNYRVGQKTPNKQSANILLKKMINLLSFSVSLGNEKCLSNPSGLNYFVTVSRTTDNIECQRWDEQKPHKHVFSTEFMGLPVSKHNNYCRNPDSRERPWCYTVDSTVPFQYCDIPKCQERK